MLKGKEQNMSEYASKTLLLRKLFEETDQYTKEPPKKISKCVRIKPRAEKVFRKAFEKENHASIGKATGLCNDGDKNAWCGVDQSQQLLSNIFKKSE